MIPGWLFHGDLPPAGNRIVCEEEEAPPAFGEYSPHWVQSGTAALSLGMLVARAQAPSVQNPSVILPAYGCPDLIAAAVYAGVLPKLVDINSGDPGYDLDKLSQAIDSTTVAVVAVNFLGIRERVEEIRRRLIPHPQVMLIEDNAQWFPEPLSVPNLTGDLVCLSFGRGKPVSLLGGGVLLIHHGREVLLPPLQDASENAFSLKLKVLIFNALLNRHLYPLVNRNPAVELGKTQYKPLLTIRALDTTRLRSVGAAARRYIELSRWAEQAWMEVFSFRSLTAAANIAPSRCGRLIRYPIMCRDVQERDVLWRLMDRAGLGVSPMYRVPLPQVSGVEGKFSVCGDYPNARDLAGRLLTVPVHAGVTQRDIERAKTITRQLGLILNK